MRRSRESLHSTVAPIFGALKRLGGLGEWRLKARPKDASLWVWVGNFQAVWHWDDFDMLDEFARGGFDSHLSMGSKLGQFDHIQSINFDLWKSLYTHLGNESTNTWVTDKIIGMLKSSQPIGDDPNLWMALSLTYNLVRYSHITSWEDDPPEVTNQRMWCPLSHAVLGMGMQYLGKLP